jgi:hypothetical protein
VAVQETIATSPLLRLTILESLATSKVTSECTAVWIYLVSSRFNAPLQRTAPKCLAYIARIRLQAEPNLSARLRDGARRFVRRDARSARRLVLPKALRLSRAAITTSELALSTNDATLKDGVGRHADGVLDAEKLAEFIEQRQGKARIGAQLDPDFGKLLLESRNQAPE